MKRFAALLLAFAAMMREGHAAWGRVIRETGVKGE